MEEKRRRTKNQIKIGAVHSSLSWQADGKGEQEESMQAKVHAKFDFLLAQPLQIFSDTQVLALARRMQLTVTARGPDLLSDIEQQYTHCP